MKKHAMFWLLAGFLLLPLQAEVLVLKNGKKFEVESYEVKGRVVVFTDSQGELIQLPTSIVDFEQSRKATEELVAVRRAKEEAEARRQAELEKKRQQQANSMAEIVDMVESRQNKGDRGAVSLDNTRLEDFNKANVRVVDGQVMDGLPSGNNSSSDAGDGGGTAVGDAGASADGPTIDQLSDPEFMARKREEVSEKYKELGGELSELEKQIKEAEYAREVNASAAAFGAEQYAGAAADGSEDGDPDREIYYERMEKAEKNLAELKKRRDELSSEQAGVASDARNVGIRDLDRKADKKSDSGGSQESDSDARYSTDGKRKTLHGSEYKSKKRQRADEAQGDERYDENGKRKKVNQ